MQPANVLQKDIRRFQLQNCRQKFRKPHLHVHQLQINQPVLLVLALNLAFKQIL